jgi:hypothetical protein
MNIYGLDFTSAPSPKKPITCAKCTLTEDIEYPTLKLIECLKLNSFTEFEDLLRSDGPWLAALDFPFGQPRKMITSLGWPDTWAGYVEMIAAMGKKSFEDALLQYCASRPAGEKHALRKTDVFARARSPMMLYRVPVAKMFFQGASRLLSSKVSILPCRPTHDNRIVVEGYPALVARRWIGSCSYKSDERTRQTRDKTTARQCILSGLHSPELLKYYSFQLELSQAQADSFVQDATGDCLDALLCAIQAAWAYSQRGNGYGIPQNCDSIEGWIVDPVMSNSSPR